MQRVYLFILVFDSTLVLTAHHVVYNVSPEANQGNHIESAREHSRREECDKGMSSD